MYHKREELATLKIAGIVDNFEPYITQDLDVEDYKAAFVLMLSKDMYTKEMSELKDTKYVFADIYISTDKPFEIEEAIEGDMKNIENSVGMTPLGENLYAERLEEESILELIKSLLYGFEIIIVVFCMTNIFYIISSSTTFRTKDFAVLKSIGMSEKQIDNMLILEGFFYGFSGLIFGTVFSLGILKLVGHFAIDTELYLFKLPLFSIVYAIIMVYSVIAISMISARHKIKYRNIIDDVRNENM